MAEVTRILKFGRLSMLSAGIANFIVDAWRFLPEEIKEIGRCHTA